MVLVSQLREKAKEMKIKGYSKMNKNELENALGLPPPSAYRSMRLSKLGLSQPSKETEEKLRRWKNENWVNLTPLLTDKKLEPCGNKGKNQKKLNLPSVCRPTIKISAETPSLAQSFSKAQIKKAIELKKQGERIMWNKL